MARPSPHHHRIPRHLAIAAAWHTLAAQWTEQHRLLRERRREAARGAGAYHTLPAAPPPPAGHRFGWVPTQPRQVCALCQAETDLILVGGASRRVWWVAGIATDELPPCRSLPVLAPSLAPAAPRRVIDAELDEDDPLASIVVARAPRPRQPRVRPERPRPAAAPRPTHRPSKETQAFLDGEEPEVDSATLRAFEAESASVLATITHADIAGERELELIIQAQIDVANTDGAMDEAHRAAERGDPSLLYALWNTPAMRRARQAADTLLRAHDKLIRMYAGRCARMAAARHGVDFDDMVQEARKGFLHGVYKFSPQHGVKISSYASYWMIQCMGRTLDKTRSLVVLPYNVIERAKRVMRTGAPITAEALTAAGKGKLNPDIAIAGAAVWSGRDISVQETVGGSGDDDDEGSLKVAGYLTSDEDVQERVVEADLAQRRAKLVHAALAELTEREREVARRRLMTDPPDPLEVIGKDLGMTRENARLIELKVKSALAAFLAAQARANDVDAEVLGDPDELEAAAELAAAA